MLMEMQKSMGKSELALEIISKDLSELKGKASRVEKIMYAAGFFLLICVATGEWLLNPAKDFVMMNYRPPLETTQTVAPPHYPPPLQAPASGSPAVSPPSATAPKPQ